MHRIQLEISNDIFDNVMFFLENLPKNKIKLKRRESATENTGAEQKKIFEHFLGHTQKVNTLKIPDRETLHAR